MTNFIKRLKPFAPIITSLADDDLYKFTMWQALLHAFPANQAEYRYRCRNTPGFPLALLKEELEAQLDHLCTLRFSEDELTYFGEMRYIKSDFVDFLRIFQFQRRFITVETDGDDLVVIAKGPQVHVMDFEIKVMAIINELYYQHLTQADDGASALAEGRRRLAAKIFKLKQAERFTKLRKNPFEFFDFGLRRRFSKAWQEEVVETLLREVPQFFKGTSNVYLAKKFGITPIGTMAHEYLQTFQAVGVQLKNFQKEALEAWVHEYRGDLGVALTDVVGMDAFLADFDLYFAKLFEGLRHDSGNPFSWGEKALVKYTQLRIDAQTKRLTFSDSLDIPLSLKLHEHFADRTQTGFGIGTNLTNDMGDGILKPLSNIMKLVYCNGQPVIKLPDSPGKVFGVDETYETYCRQVFKQYV